MIQSKPSNMEPRNPWRNLTIVCVGGVGGGGGDGDGDGELTLVTKVEASSARRSMRAYEYLSG